MYRTVGQTARTVWLLTALMGCTTDPSSEVHVNQDVGEMDMGVPNDATTHDVGLIPDAGAPPPCVEAANSGVQDTTRWTDGDHVASVTVTGAPCARRFVHHTTAPLLDGATNPRTYSEQPGRPSVSTGDDMFDALYAMALEEVREGSVDAIHDGAYNDGAPIECPPGGCFETGARWPFVWTRDTAYAVDLGLAALDPTRARNSLEFKISTRRDGYRPQIIQDTGTGGGYPVSSDRAAWAFGAMRLLAFLDGEEREAFAALAWQATWNTIEHDRAVLFDEAQGLYRGEQSFLDWREQSYPAWTADDPAQIHMSQALSTNMAHLKLLEIGAWLNEGFTGPGDDDRVQRYLGWATALRARIDAVFSHDDSELWGTFTPGTLDRAPARHYDLLGTALAVLGGVGDQARAAEVVRRYPHLPQGAPVIWPQQKQTPIYHNRALWPFVTAYWLRAARQVRNDAAVNHGVRSLMRGAAMNLSNMENFEAVSGAPWLDDGDFSGPVINSQRQLWSVAGYVSMVHDVIFGLKTHRDFISFWPYVTRELRRTRFAGTDILVLNNFPYRGRTITVVVHLPPVTDDGAGAYAMGEVRLDGQLRADGPEFDHRNIEPNELLRHSVLDITLLDTPEAADTITLETDTGEYRKLFAPLAPQMTGVSAVNDGLEITFEGGGEPADEVRFNVYRDGAKVAGGLPGDTISWIDQDATPDGPSHCYTVEAYFVLTGTSGRPNVSQRAKPFCDWGPDYARIQTFEADTFEAIGGALVLNHGREHYQGWGAEDHTLTVRGVRPDFTGEHLLQVSYGNGAGPINTGITCAVKRAEVVDEASGEVVGAGVLVMPHLGDWDRWADSSFVKVRLEAGRSYRITLLHDHTTVNMSDFEHNAIYSGGLGGVEGAYHDVNIAALKLLSLTGRR